MTVRSETRDVVLSVSGVVFATFAHVPLLYVMLRQPFEGRVVFLGVIGAALFVAVVVLAKDRLQVAAIPFLYLGIMWSIGYLKSSRGIALLFSAVFFGVGYTLIRVRNTKQKREAETATRFHSM